MNTIQQEGAPTYKRDPLYKFTSIAVPIIATLIILLFVWYSKNQVIIKEPRTITLYCFSAMEEVFEQDLLPAFQRHWLKQKQERVEFITTFAGSGIITRQIMTRFPAELAILSSELDARRLVTAGILTAASWQDLKQKPKFCQSPIVLFVRDQEDQAISAFSDIQTDSLDVVIADPLTSGEGQMVALALYGSQQLLGVNQEDALDFVKTWFSGSQNQPSTSHDALEQFLAGMGDVLFHLEAANIERASGTGIRMIYPKSTIMTEPIAVTIPKNIAPDQADLVASFHEFLWSEQAQGILTDHGFRSQLSATDPSDDELAGSVVFMLDSLGNIHDLIRNIIDPIVSQ